MPAKRGWLGHEASPSKIPHMGSARFLGGQKQRGILLVIILNDRKIDNYTHKSVLIIITAYLKKNIIIVSLSSYRSG